MDRFVFITNYSSNFEILYTGFKRDDRGFVCLPNPWDEIARKEDNKVEFYRRLLLYAIPDSGEHFHFIVYGRLLEWISVSLPRVLKDTYKHATVVCYFGDLINKHDMDFEVVKKECDYICTFDKGDAKKYDIAFCQEPYSGFDMSYVESVYDICFIGRAKDRLNKIINLFEYFEKNKLKCDFYIFDVPPDELLYPEKICYNTYLDYKDVIRHIKSSKCVLEVMQGEAVSPSTRFAEALIYNKSLLTDCNSKEIKSVPNVFYFDEIEKIEIDELLREYNYTNNYWIDYFSIEKMIDRIIEIEKNKG
uniref:Glycosyltransferase n=1 Tax=Eubacterium cellulosolvens (strain ATCC 43171 / JCM 9499 / 6) TaxID=633697 RepID=I5AW50_EUBC6